MLFRVFKPIPIIIFAIVLGFSGGYAQSNISGVVIDSLSKEPVPFANIFFANTLIGTATDVNGEFHIRNIPDGKYDFVISCVGYKTFQQAIELAKTETQSIKILLPQNLIKLNEVDVIADTAGWHQNFKTFERNFIGEFKSARECEIKKPHDIYLYFDPKDRVLVAHASQEIAIENKALGYTVFYTLQKFELNFKEERIDYYGIPRFKAMVAKKSSDEKKWSKQRERVFEGSLSHLLLSILNNKLEESEFMVNELFRIKNPERPDDDFLNTRISYWQKYKNQDENREKDFRKAEDSLQYYYELRSKPTLVDSIGKQIIDTSEVLKGNELHYKGLLRIIYKGEREEYEYTHSQGRAPSRYQYSTVHLLGEHLKIYDNGYYENVFELFLEGYLAWYEKIGNLMPLEYTLQEK